MRHVPANVTSASHGGWRAVLSSGLIFIRTVTCRWQCSDCVYLACRCYTWMWMECGAVLEDAFQGVVRYERSTKRTRPPQLPMQRCVSAADGGCESSGRCRSATTISNSRLYSEYPHSNRSFHNKHGACCIYVQLILTVMAYHIRLLTNVWCYDWCYHFKHQISHKSA